MFTFQLLRYYLVRNREKTLTSIESILLVRAWLISYLNAASSLGRILEEIHIRAPIEPMMPGLHIVCIEKVVHVRESAIRADSQQHIESVVQMLSQRLTGWPQSPHQRMPPLLEPSAHKIGPVPGRRSQLLEQCCERMDQKTRSFQHAQLKPNCGFWDSSLC